MRKTRIILTTCLIVLLVIHIPILRSEDDLHRVWAVKDCRIITQAGPPIEKGTVVIRDGLIETVGAIVDVPADAEVIDGSTLTVYPGLIDPRREAYSRAKLLCFPSAARIKMQT